MYFGNVDHNGNIFCNKYFYFFLMSLKDFSGKENICCFPLVKFFSISTEQGAFITVKSPSKNFENMLTRPEILPYLGTLLGARGSNDLAYLFEV